MSRGHVVQMLFVERDASAWPEVETFFRYQLRLVGATPDLHFRQHLPERIAGFDLVSLDGRGLIPALMDHEDLLADLRRTAIVNLHAEMPGTLYGDLRFLLGRRDEGTRSDGLWVFPRTWMAPWFLEALEFPELGLRSGLVPPRPATPDRTWDRRSIHPLRLLMDPFVPATAKG